MSAIRGKREPRDRGKTERGVAEQDAANRPNQDDVARRAYELYQQRGAEPGHDLDDWFAAERELNERAAKEEP